MSNFNRRELPNGASAFAAGVTANEAVPSSNEDSVLQAKIARARLSGPAEITTDASIAEMDAGGSITILVREPTTGYAFLATKT